MKISIRIPSKSEAHKSPIKKITYITFPFFLLIPIMLAGVLSGCSSGKPSGEALEMAPMSGMPAEVKQAPLTVQEAYQFAVANPEALQNVPCYCGCGAAGHTSNYDCYVKETDPSGQIVIDQHALGCSICVDIARDVMSLTREGKAPEDIRTAIDQTYSQYGPSNMPETP